MNQAHNIRVGDKVKVGSMPYEFTVTDIDFYRDEALLTHPQISSRWPVSQCTKINSDTETRDQISTAMNSIMKKWADDFYKHPGTLIAPHTVYTTTDSIFKWPESGGVIEWKVDEATIPKLAMCECGSSKTYGENCNSDLHSTWCALYRKA